MLRIGVLCIFGLLLAQAVSASTREERAREMAECGYLAVLAADGASGAARKELVRDVVDFANLYYAYARFERPLGETGVTQAMLERLTKDGRALHARRLTAISETNALRLSNRLLATCRTDLRLLIIKFRKEAGIGQP